MSTQNERLAVGADRSGTPSAIARDERHQEMGKKTVKRLAILIGVMALLGGGGYYLRAFQVNRMAHGIVARAERAEAAGQYDQAEALYREHLAVVRGDTEVQLKYAEVLLKHAPTARRQEEALAIFEAVLTQYPGNAKVRRRAADVAFDLGRAKLDKASQHVAILLRSEPNNGHLEYLMGRCQEEQEEFALAVESYASAIAHKAPEWIEASQRQATLLRDKLGKKDDADRIIDAMIKQAAGDYRAYLGRGRYRAGTGGKASPEDIRGALADLRKALQLAKDRPEVYVEVADAVIKDPSLDQAGRYAEAHRILDDGLKVAPKSIPLYVKLADLEQRANRVDEAIKTLERGVEELPEELQLRSYLAILLASKGEQESARLLRQIKEMGDLGANRLFTQYLTAYYHANRHEYFKAKEILTPLLPDVAQIPEMRARVNLLLAQCYQYTGELEQRKEALQKAVVTEPNDPRARITALAVGGDLDGAIRECQAWYRRQPDAARLVFASLLIDRIGRLPRERRVWKEPERLIDDAAKAAPRAVEPVRLRAELLTRQADEAGACKVLEDFARSSKDLRAWIALIELLVRQGRAGREDAYDKAEIALNQARQQLGDRVELRLARMQLVSARGGPQVVPALKALGDGLDAFSWDDTRLLLTALADQLLLRQDLKGSIDFLKRLAVDERGSEDLSLKLRLFDLTLRTPDAERAEDQIGEIKELEAQFGHDTQFGQLCDARFRAWQARGATDPEAKKALRGEARTLLGELRDRRPDWGQVPLALARMDEEELTEATTGPARRQELLESAIASYRRAIELGLRDEPGVIAGYFQLLFRAGRQGEAVEFVARLPEGSQVAHNLTRVAAQYALATRDPGRAEELARKAIRANPGDFQDRMLLAHALQQQGHTDEAIAMARQGVEAARADPDRWIAMVRFLVMVRRLGQAEQAIRDAEAPLAAAPVALAQCCGIVGKAFELVEPERSRPWYRLARDWYARAQQALKDPKDLSVKRQLVEFLLQTSESADAEAPLKEIVAATADGQSPPLAAWARRNLARVYVAADPPRIDEALKLFAGKSGQGDDADDLRVMSLIREAQGTPEARQRAIDELKTLVARDAATPEDRRRLAQLLELSGNWSDARDQFRQLIQRVDAAPSDPETAARRPMYVALFVEGLLRHHKPGDNANLDEARRLVETLKATQPEPALLLEVQIDKAAKQPEAALKRVQDYAGRPDVTPAGRLRLAFDLERIGQLDVAEWAFRRAAQDTPPNNKTLPNGYGLALFLAHRGKIKGAIDRCEEFWKNPAIRELVANLCVSILCDPAASVDEVQIRRVLDWFKQAAVDDPRSMAYHVGLANLYERLAEYPAAEQEYRTAIKTNDRDGIAANNLAWLILLHGGRRDEALEKINLAISAKGPLAEYLDTRGMVYLAIDQGRRALEDLEAAFRAAPTTPKYFHLAQAYLKLGNKEKARDILKAGKARGLPTGLHRLEVDEYKKIAGDLGIP